MNFVTFTNLNQSFLYHLNFYLGIYPELFFIFAILIYTIFLIIIDYIYRYNKFLIEIAGKLLILLLSLLSIITLNNWNLHIFSFDKMFELNNLTIFISVTLSFLAILVILIMSKYIKSENIIQYEYFILLSLALLGLLVINHSNDLISMYIGIELQSLPFYVLAAFKMRNNFSTEAGLKYFVLGAISSGIILLGCSLLYGLTGLLTFSDFQLLFQNFNLLNSNLIIGLTISIIFITVGLLFKLGAVPFHAWLPDVYEGSPTSVTAIFSILPKIVIFSLFFRVLYSFHFINFFYLQQFLLYSAILSIIIGSLNALYQTKLKRLFAYSAISHVGFMLISFSSISIFSFFSLFFYIVVYMIMTLNVFSMLLCLRTIDTNLKIKKLNEIAILFKSNPFLALNFTIIMFSFAGIPPLVGFYSKFYILLAAIKADFYIIALIAVIFSVLASLYYIRFIKLLYFKNLEYWYFLQPIPRVNSLVISITFIFNLLFFFYPEVIVLFIYNIILQYYQ